MKVFLREDVEKIGMKGEIIVVKAGFARNYLIPKDLAQEVTPSNESYLSKRARKVIDREVVLSSQNSMLAEKISKLQIKMIKKTHDEKKLYGSIGTGDVANLLATKGFSVKKSQIAFEKNKKAIKTAGPHIVTVRLSSKLQPTFVLKVTPEK